MVFFGVLSGNIPAGALKKSNNEKCISAIILLVYFMGISVNAKI